MSYEIERERFMVAMEHEGMSREIARRILRHANTVQRLAVVACNGDRRPYVPCPGNPCLCDQVNGQPHEPIPPVAIEQARAERLVREWCAKATSFVSTCKCVVEPHGPNEPCCRQCSPDCCEWRRFEPIFQGDPRGCCVKLRVPSGRTDDGGREGMCVPTRRC